MEGVELKELKVWSNDQGYLFETVRNDDKLFDGKFGQVLVSVVYYGVIKGLHKHNFQTDYTTCIKGSIKYCVANKIDENKVDIKTYIIGEKNPILIKVSPGIWHGYTPIGNKDAIVLHLMDKVYDPSNQDTEKIDPFTFGDVWTVKNG